MKNAACVLVILVLGLLLMSSNVTVNYYVDGIDNTIVQQSFNSWNFKKVVWKEVLFEEDANLIIKKTSYLTVPTRYGEANTRIIKINSKYKFSEKELVSLISHEIGHYVFLGHNNKHSIMNDKIKLKDKTVTEEDKKINFIRLRIFAVKILGCGVDLSKN